MAGAVLNASRAPSISFLIGTFMPGLVLVIIGLKLGQKKSPRIGSEEDREDGPIEVVELVAPDSSGLEDNRRAESLRLGANLGIGGGIILMFLGSAIIQRSSESPVAMLAGLLLAFAGWSWEIWGCVSYMRWKGYSGWLGVLAYLLLPGLIVLACIPNKRKRLLRFDGPGCLADLKALSVQDSMFGYRFLLLLLPAVLLCILFCGIILFFISIFSITEWTPVAPPEIGYKALMPGTPQLVEKTEETPAGKIQLHKFISTPKSNQEVYIISSIRFPAGIGRELGGPEKLLAIGKDDVLQASNGQLKSERRIELNGRPGLELEVLPPQGAIIKARIYSLDNQIFQLSVHVPKIRVTSEDVQKFFDSFELVVEPNPANNRGEK